ncbi:hypothetical protein GGTG_09164 [Gaeumannomyces tritici R3-111a-1]|uniref:Uncharacterized protein n=1 Tax=Gaeumannomyces tritici (strain R3-111a-1) TaxID=644352 RepID=J3P6M2_GAET3|nr:hypothetical protein GGTG_09164 [Gaeumannomyces tritici R3-111a-1]EJT72298.1 hypothetical protein GGTG_09164 [Gaeumannomyces tritici R3-111a-1]
MVPDGTPEALSASCDPAQEPSHKTGHLESGKARLGKRTRGSRPRQRRIHFIVRSKWAESGAESDCVALDLPLAHHRSSRRRDPKSVQSDLRNIVTGATGNGQNPISLPTSTSPNTPLMPCHQSIWALLRMSQGQQSGQPSPGASAVGPGAERGQENDSSNAFASSATQPPPPPEHRRPKIVFKTTPTEPAKPTVPIAPTEFVEPTESVKPTKPTQPAVPAVPAKPIESVKPTQPTQPAVPARPARPFEPGELLRLRPLPPSLRFWPFHTDVHLLNILDKPNYRDFTLPANTKSKGSANSAFTKHGIMLHSGYCNLRKIPFIGRVPWWSDNVEQGIFARVGKQPIPSDAARAGSDAGKAAKKNAIKVQDLAYDLTYRIPLDIGRFKGAPVHMDHCHIARG